jgi:hypothetical protein
MYYSKYYVRNLHSVLRIITSPPGYQLRVRFIVSVKIARNSYNYIRSPSNRTLSCGILLYFVSGTKPSRDRHRFASGHCPIDDRSTSRCRYASRFRPGPWQCGSCNACRATYVRNASNDERSVNLARVQLPIDIIRNPRPSTEMRRPPTNDGGIWTDAVYPMAS